MAYKRRELILDKLKAWETLDSNYMNVQKNIRFEQADVPDATNMTVQIGDGGFLKLSYLPNPNVVWRDENTSDVKVTEDAEVLLTSITIGEAISANQSTFQFTCQIDNDDRKDQLVDFIIKHNSTEIRRETVKILGNEQNKVIGLTGNIQNSFVANDTFSVYAISHDKDIIINGANYKTVMQIEKFVNTAAVHSLTIAGTEPTLAELQSLGISDKAFFIDTGSDIFIVKQINGNFYYTKLTQAV